jgi:hypothetical protein
MPTEDKPSFNEMSLRADVIKMWGEAGAHVAVLDHLISAAKAIPSTTEGIFIHQCISPGCGTLVEYDDEPCCFKHSPDEGSHLPFYSARDRLTAGLIPNQRKGE